MGLCRFEGEEIHREAVTEQFRELKVNALFMDDGAESKDSVLLGYDDGVHRLRDGKLERVDEPGWPQVHVNHLTWGNQGELWIASNAGLHRIDGDETRSFSTPGVPLQVTVSPVDGEVALRLESGVALMSPEEEISTLSREKGLASEFIHTMVYDSSGALWIGANSGLQRYHDGESKRSPLRMG